MIPIKFKYENSTLLGSPDGTVGDLPVFKDGQQIVSCWKMSWRERWSAFLFGRVWVVVAAADTHAPLYLVAQKEHLREIGTSAPK